MTGAHRVIYGTRVAGHDEVLAQVLSLPENARADIALQLLDSLAPEDPHDEQEWIVEVERRARRVLSGWTGGSPWEEVRARIERRVRER